MLRFCPLNFTKVLGRLTEQKSNLLILIEQGKRILCSPQRFTPCCKELVFFTLCSANLLQKMIKLYTICADAVCLLAISCDWLPTATFELILKIN